MKYLMLIYANFFLYLIVSWRVCSHVQCFCGYWGWWDQSCKKQVAKIWAESPTSKNCPTVQQKHDTVMFFLFMLWCVTSKLIVSPQRWSSTRTRKGLDYISTTQQQWKHLCIINTVFSKTKTDPHTVKKINSTTGKNSTLINHQMNSCLLTMTNSHFWKGGSSSTAALLTWLKWNTVTKVTFKVSLLMQAMDWNLVTKQEKYQKFQHRILSKLEIEIDNLKSTAS